MAGHSKSEPVNPQMDWAFMNSADQTLEIPADGEINLNIGADQVSSKLDEIRAL